MHHKMTAEEIREIIRYAKNDKYGKISPETICHRGILKDLIN
jgi:hypothetical protein